MGRLIPAPTTLTETLTTAQGCDSIVITAIDIFSFHNILGQMIEGCDQVVFNGTVYTSSTTLGNTFTSVNGCDSIVGTQIIVYNSVFYDPKRCRMRQRQLQWQYLQCDDGLTIEVFRF